MKKIIIAAIVLISLHGEAFAYANDCKGAIRQYKLAVNSIEQALNFYTQCLNSSRGKRDCSQDFLMLKLSQVDYEFAVRDIKNYCELR